jgi:hypothetical protein
MWRWNQTRSPYLIEGRLADVLAAIQVMGSAKRPEAAIAKLAADLDGNEDERTVSRWTAVFNDHREFFRVYRVPSDHTLKAALRWRYAYKRFDPETQKEYSEAEFQALDESGPELRLIRDRLTMKPLEPEQVQTLLNTAIGLRTAAMEEYKASVWWVPLLAAVLAFVGTIVGTLVSASLGLRK